MSSVIAIDTEIKLEKGRYLVSETDAKGIITYCNEYFNQISGYTQDELIGQQHNIIRHPDMPKVVFKLLWERIQSGKNINAVVKNLSKDGRYYWIFTEFKTRVDLDINSVIGYTAHRKLISDDVVEVIDVLYKKLIIIEEEQNVHEAEVFLDKYLKEFDKKINFVNLLDYIHKLY